MRWAWIAAPAALVLVAACREGSTAESDAVESTETNLSAQGLKKANALLDDAAVAWVSKDDWGFVQGGRCVMSCHTTVPFMLVAGTRARAANVDAGASDAGTSALSVVRGHVETRVDRIVDVYEPMPEPHLVRLVRRSRVNRL